MLLHRFKFIGGCLLAEGLGGVVWSPLSTDIDPTTSQRTWENLDRFKVGLNSVPNFSAISLELGWQDVYQPNI